MLATSWRSVPVLRLGLVSLLLAIPATSQAQGLAAAANEGVFPKVVPPAVARTWLALHRVVDLEFAEETSLGDALKRVQELTKGPGLPDGVAFYVAAGRPGRGGMDPSQGGSAERMVKLSLKGQPLFAGLGLVADQSGMGYSVDKDGVVVLEPTPMLVRPGEFVVGGEFMTEAQARTWLRLSRAEGVAFSEETPLKAVLAFVREHSQEPGLAADQPSPVLPIYLDPRGLEKAEKTEDAAVVLDVANLPLSTTLALMLDQVGLTYRVQEDGLLVVTSPGRASLFEPVPAPIFRGMSRSMGVGMGGAVGMGGGGGGFR